MSESRSSKISKYIIYFALYAFVGWLYEVFLEVVVYHWGFSNRGVLFGPYLPVYGVGALAFLLLVYPVIRKKETPYETEEGCLSLDGVRRTTRYQNIELEYLDSSWKKHRQKFSGWTAQIVQHEIDHFSGKII